MWVRPARAGMSPAGVGVADLGERPPRASGDEPAATWKTPDCTLSAPRERG